MKKNIKLTVQLPPISKDDEQTVQFQLKNSGDWQTVTEAQINPNARIATFKMNNWDDTKDHEYRVLYVSKLLGHQAIAICLIIANRLNKNSNENYKENIKELISYVLTKIAID